MKISVCLSRSLCVCVAVCATVSAGLTVLSVWILSNRVLFVVVGAAIVGTDPRQKTPDEEKWGYVVGTQVERARKSGVSIEDGEALRIASSPPLPHSRPTPFVPDRQLGQVPIDAGSWRH